MAFAARPKVVNQKQKYRDQEEEEQAGFQMNNIMWDRRVVRGNTYASIVASKTIEPLTGFSRVKRSLRKESEQTASDEQRVLKRRVSIQIVTDEAVQTMTDKPPIYQKDTQTQPLPIPPIVRHLVKEKTGEDKDTQIMDGDLFNFNYQVQPLLKVIVGKSLQVARMQVLQEKELQVMKDRQIQLKRIEQKEKEKVRLMEIKEKKMAQDYEVRKAQARKKLERNVYIHKKLVSRVIAKQLIKPLWAITSEQLTQQNYFSPAFMYELHSQVLPKLVAESQQHLTAEKTVVEVLHNWAHASVKRLQSEFSDSIQTQQARRAVILQQRQQRERQKLERKYMKMQQKWAIAFQAEEIERAKLASELKQSAGHEGAQEESKQE